MSKRSLSEMSRAVASRMRSRRESGLQSSSTSARRPAHIPADPSPELLDWVELKQQFDQWPAGTRGSVVDVKAYGALVEISDDRGHSVDMFRLPLGDLRLARD